jgi:hypothetical protein
MVIYTTPPNVPLPATSMPPGVSDNGAIGTVQRYALENHTHASKARKQIVTMGSAASTYTWVYPTAFGTGVVPVCSAIVQVSAGNQDLFNVQISGVPTNTQCTFQINRVSAGLLSLLLGALSINPTPVAATLHMIALEP